jgi:formate dehydrogenase subunit gamma
MHIDETSEAVGMPHPPRERPVVGRDAASLQVVLDQHAARPGALLPVLHAVQALWGYVPDDAVPAIAQALNLSRAEVHGVLTYYPHFRRQPPAQVAVQVCMAEACRACGADAVMAQAQVLLRCAPHETRADGQASLEPVYCLGLCSAAPALQIGPRQHARVSPQALPALLGPALAESGDGA